jgi:hypothetical protein
VFGAVEAHCGCGDGVDGALGVGFADVPGSVVAFSCDAVADVLGVDGVCVVFELGLGAEHDRVVERCPGGAHLGA